MATSREWELEWEYKYEIGTQILFPHISTAYDVIFIHARHLSVDRLACLHAGVVVVDAMAADVEAEPKVDAAATSTSVPSSEPDQRQSRSLSIIARAIGKGPDPRRPSTVAAVFAAATTRWSRRASSLRPGQSSSDEDDVTSRPRRLTGSSVTWKDVGIADHRPDMMTSDTRPRVEHIRRKRKSTV